jgi:hypothetical protein
MGVSTTSPELQEHPMTTFITQTGAREQINEMISQARQSRIRREIRRARREARLERRLMRRASRGPSNNALYAPNRFGLAGVR